MDNWRNFVRRTLQEAYHTKWYWMLHCETSLIWGSRPFERLIRTGIVTDSSARATSSWASVFVSGILWIYARIWTAWPYKPDQWGRKQHGRRAFITLHITQFWRVPAVQHPPFVYFNPPLQSFTPIYYTINNYTGFAAMVSEPFANDVLHVHAVHVLLLV